MYITGFLVPYMVEKGNICINCLYKASPRIIKNIVFRSHLVILLLGGLF